MSKYLVEMKNRMFILTFAWLISLCTCYLYKEVILYIILKPSLLESTANTRYFIYTNLTELFSTYLDVTFFVSNHVLLLLFIFQIYCFLKPSLYKYECNFIKQTITHVVIVSLISSTLTYCLIIPYSWDFFLNFEKSKSNNVISLHFEAKLFEYIRFFYRAYFLCTMTSLLFYLLLFSINTINYYTLYIRKYRKIIYFLIFLWSATLTPPDVPSLLLFSFVIIFHYEAVVFTILLKKNYVTNIYNSLIIKKVNS